MGNDDAQQGQFNGDLELNVRFPSALPPGVGPTSSKPPDPRTKTGGFPRYFAVQTAEIIDPVSHTYHVPFRAHEIESITLKKVEPQPENPGHAHVLTSKAFAFKGRGEPVPVVIRLGKIDYVLEDSKRLALERGVVEPPTAGDLDDAFSPEKINVAGREYIRADVALDAIVKQCKPDSTDTEGTSG